MIQGGDPQGTGMGGPGYSIKGEFAANGFQNDLKHTEGVLSMARSMMPDSAGSQFFIMHKNAPHLDGSYAAFGKIIEGMDVVNKIAETPTDYSDSRNLWCRLSGTGKNVRCSYFINISFKKTSTPQHSLDISALYTKSIR